MALHYDRYRTDKPGITDPLHPARFAVPFGSISGCVGQKVGATMKPEQLEALCKHAKHEIKIFVNRVAKREIAAMRAAWGAKP